MIKRLLTTIIGIPLLFIVLIYGNKYIVDIIVAIFAFISIHEYMKCYSNKFKTTKWVRIPKCFWNCIFTHNTKRIYFNLLRTIYSFNCSHIIYASCFYRNEN